eukprot:959472_1
MKRVSSWMSKMVESTFPVMSVASFRSCVGRIDDTIAFMRRTKLGNCRSVVDFMFPWETNFEKYHPRVVSVTLDDVISNTGDNSMYGVLVEELADMSLPQQPNITAISVDLGEVLIESDYEIVVNIIEKLFPNLKSLEILSASGFFIPIPDSIADYISEYVTQLHFIFLGCNDCSYLMDNLPKHLSHLSIGVNSAYNVETITKIVRTCRNVASLAICSEIYVKHKFRLLEKNPHIVSQSSLPGLKRLHIEYDGGGDKSLRERIIEIVFQTRWQNLKHFCLVEDDRSLDNPTLEKCAHLAFPNLQSISYIGRIKTLKAMTLTSDGLPKMENLKYLCLCPVDCGSYTQETLSGLLRHIKYLELAVTRKWLPDRVRTMLFGASANLNTRFGTKNLSISYPTQSVIDSMIQCEWPELTRLKIVWKDNSSTPQNLAKLAARLPALRSVDVGAYLFDFLSAPDTLPLLSDAVCLDEMERQLNENVGILLEEGKLDALEEVR